ncbi:alpha-hydroxy acid oxidase [Blastococcus brunescens]|uniref:Alpha-hydroxy acid oxidase n=1 Tax=Blastococcus brunescens TaxID=1564165 RepID=A0ABZ1B6T3_9ACTN|nr:alpha-hydroxy acid oxidase [Blastococcus sp. BMG 8361]WRL65104.1 alpha-hydroxy acid oxidase [Blastococcus sp. BMG 8361]
MTVVPTAGAGDAAGAQQPRRRIKRRLPRWGEIAPMVFSGPPELDATARRLAAAHDVEDLRRIARRRTPASVFDYVDGAAETESADRRNVDAFGRVEFVPQVLRDVSSVDPSVRILGKPAAMPLIFAPTGFTRMMHHEGEIAVARVAERVGVPYAISTMGTTSPEDVAAAAPGSDRWFQLYMWRDRSASQELMARAEDAGYTTLVLTVDVPVAGARLRDLRSGMTLPPSLNARSFAGIARHPHWWINVLTRDPLKFAALEGGAGQFMELTDRILDPSVTSRDLDWLRQTWRGRIVVKGVLSVEGARDIVDRGVDAIVVSNHGGRQLDRAVAPLDVLPDMRSALQRDAEIYLDGGVRSGTDVAAAVALGADAVMIGRPYLYGLMAGGARRTAGVRPLPAGFHPHPGPPGGWFGGRRGPSPPAPPDGTWLS